VADRNANAARAAHVMARTPALLEAWRAAIATDPQLTTSQSLPRAQRSRIPAPAFMPGPARLLSEGSDRMNNLLRHEI